MLRKLEASRTMANVLVEEIKELEAEGSSKCSSFSCDKDKLSALNPTLLQYLDSEGSESSARKAGTKTRKTMKDLGIREVCMHGNGPSESFDPPEQVTVCNEEARPGYDTHKAHEYNDTPNTLKLKVKRLADMFRKAQHPVAYTGAGISTASGISDYASKSAASQSKGVKKASGKNAMPTFAHFALNAIYNAGYLSHWIQQNHDGLPQKAGFPQEKLNEIHGAWFDPSNPVVPMAGTLRTYNYEWLEAEEAAADLVVAMGTSLCGMSADDVVKAASKRAKSGNGLGAVIISLQQTALDKVASLKIYGKLDDVMMLLAQELALDVSLEPAKYRARIPTQMKVKDKPHTYILPYTSRGEKSKDKTSVLDLSVGARVQLTDGPGKGFLGTVKATPAKGKYSYVMTFPCNREGSKEFGKVKKSYCLGDWWIEAACRSAIHRLPVINPTSSKR